MKFRWILIMLLFCLTKSMRAQDCVLPISVQLDNNFTNVPVAAESVLYQSLMRIATANGLTTEAPTSPFVLTAHCDVLEKSVLPGPPVQVVYNLGTTLYLADTYTQKKFAVAYLQLNGVGSNETKSYINAFKRINANASEVVAMINQGKSNMTRYYDTQYPQIIKEAKRLVSLQKYEEALAMVLSIPVCSKGGEEASRYGLEVYTKHLNRLNLYLLNQARGLWAAGQTQEVAYQVCAMLAQIDPDAACYADAAALMSEVKSQVRSDIDFEVRQKYNDQIQLENARIATAKAVGVAFGNGQKPTTTNLMWLK